MALYNNVIRRVEEEEENPGAHAEKVKSLLIGGLETVGNFYDAGDKAAGIYEPAEAVSDKLSEIPIIGGPTSFAWDVFRPDFMDAAAFKAGPVAGGGQYVGSLPAGVARATAKRINSNQFKSIVDGIFDAPRKLSDWGKRTVEDAQYLFGGGVGTGTGVGGKGVRAGWGADPRIDWSSTEGAEQAKLFRDQFTDAVLTDDINSKNPLVYKREVKTSPRGVDISKRKESGYKFLGFFAKEWNAWSKSTKFLDELADRPSTAFVEHLIGKGKRNDWFWNLPDNVRFRKGTRHSPNNTRIFYSNRQKSLKDAVENLFYPMQENVTKMKRLLVDYDLPPLKPGESITVRKPAGDIVLRQVDGTIVGRFGDYHDIMYAPADVLAEALTTNINPRTNKFYIDPNTTDMQKAIQKWREKIILDKIKLIMEEAPTFKGRSPGDVFQEQAGEILDTHLADFNKEYDFIPKPKGNTLDAQIKSTSFEGPPPDIGNLLREFGEGYTPEMDVFFTENPKGMEMLVDVLRGEPITEVKKRYKGFNPDQLELVFNQLTQEQVQRIAKQYGLSGKGGLGKTDFRPPFKDLNKTLESQTTKIKGTGRVRKPKPKNDSTQLSFKQLLEDILRPDRK